MTLSVDEALATMARLVRLHVAVDDDPEREMVARTRFVAWANRPKRRWSAAWTTVGVAAAAGIAGVAWRPAAPMRYEIIAASGSQPQPALLGAGTLVRFADATELEFGSDGRGWLAETTAFGARVVVDSGSLRARVTPSGKALWTVQAGPFLVRVKGTAFKVDWQRQAGRFAIVMSHGSVQVEGPGFQRLLGSGQTLEATSAGLVRIGSVNDSGPAANAALPTPPRALPVLEPRPQPHVTRSRPKFVPSLRRGAGEKVRQSTWSQRLARGQFAAVVADAEARGIDRVLAVGTFADVAALATAARLAHRPGIARRALETQRARFFGTPAGREATFYLGWIADESHGDRAAAVRWYDHYLADAPDGALVEEATGRKLRALLTIEGAGARAAARETARAYLVRFPDGAHAPLARRLMEPE
jgi:hypothetical protein